MIDPNQDFIDLIKKAKENNELVFFIGAGVSMAQGYPNWDGYVQHLIDYWKFNDSVTHNNIDLIKFLDWLSQSELSNARKIDVIQYLISKDNSGVSKTEFENKYFGHLQLSANHNDLIRELSKLRATYITTNYDSGIEKELQAIEFPSIISSSKEFDQLYGQNKLSQGSKVIYLHGRYDSKPEDIINSSTRYSKFYYNQEWRHKIGEYLKNKTVVFIGSSLQEDELLSILNLKYAQNCFALMKGYLNQNIEKNISEYYQDQHYIQIEWYGNEFTDLLPFVKSLVTSVNAVDQLDDTTKQAFMNANNQEDFIKALNKIITTKSYVKFDELLGKIDSSGDKSLNVIKWISESDNINDHEMLLSNNLWNLISEKFEELDAKQQKLWLDKIKAGLGIPINAIDHIFSILNQYSTKSEKSIDDILIDYLPLGIAYRSLDCNLIDEKVLGHFVVENMVSQTIPMMFDLSDLTNKIIEFTTIDRDNLIKFINNGFTDEKNIGNLVIEEIKMLSNKPKLKYLINLIINKRLNSEDVREIINECTVIQKYLIHYDVKNGLDAETLGVLINNVDLSEQFLGPYMNEFVEKHKLSTNVEYKDGIWENEMINDNPFIESGMIKYQEVNEALKSMECDPYSNYVHDKYEYALDILQSHYQIDEIKNIYTRMFEHPDEYHSEIISRILWASKPLLKDKFYRDLFVNYTLNEKLNNQAQFYLVGNLLDVQISKEDLSRIVENLKKINLGELNTDTGFRNDEQNYLDMNGFIKSDLGSYFYLLHQNKQQLQVLKNIGDYFEGIDTIDDRWSNFIKGYFYEDLKDNYQIDYAAVDTFIGYSNSYVGFNKSELGEWKEAVTKIIQIEEFNTSGNPYIAVNLTRCILNNSEIFKNVIVENINNKLLDEIFLNLVKFRFAGQLNSTPLLQLCCEIDSRFQNKLLNMLFRRFENKDVIDELIGILKRNNYNNSVELNKFYNCEVNSDNADKFINFCNEIINGFTIVDTFRNCFALLRNKSSEMNKAQVEELCNIFDNLLNESEKKTLIQQVSDS